VKQRILGGRICAVPSYLHERVFSASRQTAQRGFASFLLWHFFQECRPAFARSTISSLRAMFVAFSRFLLATLRRRLSRDGPGRCADFFPSRSRSSEFLPFDPPVLRLKACRLASHEEAHSGASDPPPPLKMDYPFDVPRDPTPSKAVSSPPLSPVGIHGSFILALAWRSVSTGLFSRVPVPSSAGGRLGGLLAFGCFQLSLLCPPLVRSLVAGRCGRRSRI